MLAFIRKLFRGDVDASTAKGQLTLLILLAVLCYLFNWESALSRPYCSVRGSLQASPSTYCDPLIAAKIAHPFQSLDLQSDTSGHYEKLAFRLVPFVIAHVLRIDQRGLFCVQILLGIIFPILLWKLLFAATKSTALATGGAVLINGLYCGFAFFFDYMFFDAFAYFFLLCAMLPLPRWASLAFLLCAGFTDERALAAASLVPVWRLIIAPDPTVRRTIAEALWLLAFLALYAALRFGIGSLTGLAMGHRGIGFDLLRLNLPNIVLLVWSVFEGGWLIVVLAAFRAWDAGTALHRGLAGAAVLCFAAVFLAGLLVGDSVRSHQYAFPLLLIAIAVAGRQPSAIPPRLLGLAIILTLISPITLYFGMDPVGERTVYNLFLLRPGYLQLFGL